MNNMNICETMLLLLSLLLLLLLYDGCDWSTTIVVMDIGIDVLYFLYLQFVVLVYSFHGNSVNNVLRCN